jgi:hypothetical protein
MSSMGTAMRQPYRNLSDVKGITQAPKEELSERRGVGALPQSQRCKRIAGVPR